jgi:small-conductance mechanosensitive channel
MALLGGAHVIHPVTMGRIRTFVAALVALLTIACMSAASAVAEPLLSTPAVQPATGEQSEEAAEAAEAQEEAAEVGAEAAPAFQRRATSKQSASTSRKISQLTRQIDHLRVVQARIRARRRQLRQLPAGSERRKHGLAVQTEKLLRKRHHLFLLQKERRALEGR